VKFPHKGFADCGTRNFLFPPLLQISFDTVSNRLYRVDAHGTLLACSLQPVDNLDPVVAFSSTVFLNHQRHHFFHPLISGKPTVTIGALSPAPDHVAVFAQARIDNAIVSLMAEGTLHVEDT